MKQRNNKTMQRGVAIYLAIVIMAVILAIALGISTIFIGQIKITRGMENSVVALYAADTGIGKEMYEYRKLGGSKDVGDFYCDYLDLDNDGEGGVADCLGNPAVLDEDDAWYKVTIVSTFPSYVIQSLGAYKGARRAIEVTLPALLTQAVLWQTCEDVAPSLGGSSGFTITAGYKFTPQQNIEVTQLCGYFNGTSTVILYNSAREILDGGNARVPISNDTPDLLDCSGGEWVCSSLPSPVKLLANNEYYVIAEIPSSTTFCFRGNSEDFLPTDECGIECGMATIEFSGWGKQPFEEWGFNIEKESKKAIFGMPDIVYLPAAQTGPWGSCEETLAPNLDYDSTWLDVAAGYRFTPQQAIEVTQLCGYFPDPEGPETIAYDVVLYHYNSLLPEFNDIGVVSIKGNASPTDCSGGTWECRALPGPPYPRLDGGEEYYVVAELVSPRGFCERDNPDLPPPGDFLPTNGNCGIVTIISSGFGRHRPNFDGFILGEDTYVMWGIPDIIYLPVAE